MNSIKQLRHQLGLSQSILAHILDVDQGSLSKYESAQKRLPLRLAFKLIHLAAERNVTLSLDKIYAHYLPLLPFLSIDNN